MSRTSARTGLGVVAGALVVAGATTLLITGAGGSGDSKAASPLRRSAPTAPVATSSSTPLDLADATAPAPPAALPGSTRPTRVRIPSIGVDSGLQSLGVTSGGELQSPSKWQRAGWFSGGVRPGDVGPAVIAGHIDSTAGPAVFARLDKLRVGAQVIVTRADHRVLRFAVDRVQRFPKKAFPTQAVYGPTSLPLLRLITCTGQFDRAHRNYLDNLIVTTHLVSS